MREYKYATLFPPPPPQPWAFPAATFATPNDTVSFDDLQHDRARFAEVRAREADWETPRGLADPVTAALRRELRRYRYKPGVELSIEPPVDPKAYGAPTFRYNSVGGWMGGPTLTVRMRVPDSRAPDPADLPWQQRPMEPALVEVAARYGVPEPIWSEFVGWSPLERRNYFRAFLREKLRDMEDHELDEWFRCDGELVNDPHKPKPPPVPLPKEKP